VCGSASPTAKLIGLWRQTRGRNSISCFGSTKLLQGLPRIGQHPSDGFQTGPVRTIILGATHQPRPRSADTFAFGSLKRATVYVDSSVRPGDNETDIASPPIESPSHRYKPFVICWGDLVSSGDCQDKYGSKYDCNDDRTHEFTLWDNGASHPPTIAKWCPLLEASNCVTQALVTGGILRVLH